MKKINIINISQHLIVTICIVLVLSLYSCKTQIKQKEPFNVACPEWVANATIYEVNIRQYTPEGTFKAFENHLPRLKELGVDILWFMPVFPIGEVNKKATQTLLAEEISIPEERKKYLGSYYSIKDYFSVNPEFGSIEDFRSLVNKIHDLGMHVILDIAINHTSWDHPWIKSHPEYYMRVEKGSTPWNPEWMKQHPEYYKRLQELGMTYPIHPGETDWWDTAELNFDNKDLRNEFKEIFRFWINEFNIDGYRCDVAGDVPTDFWNELRPEIDKGKPIFMLAESEKPELLQHAFSADYAWWFKDIVNKIAKGENSVLDLERYFLESVKTYPKSTIKMNFITNHDENSWNGTEFERLGNSVKTMAALSFVIPGMPLIYSGQEVGLNRRLKFFEKDSIVWNDSLELTPFYKKLVELKKNTSVLAAGLDGADIFRVKSSNDVNVFAFIRENENEKLFAIFNLSALEQIITLEGEDYDDTFTDFFSGESKSFTKDETITLKPWEFHIYLK